MIIVEGPDGAGKSTLVTRLAKELKLPVADKVVASDTTALTDLAEWTVANVNKGFQPMIFDRHRLISEPIYGPILKPRQDEHFGDMSWLSQQLWMFYALKPIIIYALPDIRTVRENVMREDTDNAVVQDRIAAIYVAYVNRAALDATRGVGRLYNYKTTRWDDLIGWVNMNLEGRLPDAARVGFPRPRTEGVHPRADDGGRLTPARWAGH